MIYARRYLVGGTEYGIEDLDVEPEKTDYRSIEYLEGHRPRYQCWVGGCGVGRTSDMMDAERILREYARVRAGAIKDTARAMERRADAMINFGMWGVDDENAPLPVPRSSKI